MILKRHKTNIVAILTTISILTNIAPRFIKCSSNFNQIEHQDSLYYKQQVTSNSTISSIGQASGECGPYSSCQNGGTCKEGPQNFTCVCPEGFTGPYCDQDVNECARKPNVCQNMATCVNNLGGYQCMCVNGWTGHDCSINVDDCSKAACMNGATCHDLVGHFQCECPPDKTGILCQHDNGCFNNPCRPNATCDPDPTDGHAICTCPLGFTGDDCSIDIDECAGGSPCEHGGRCVNTPGSFKCDCPSGFNGSRCEIDIPECDSKPCKNGQCLDDKGGYRCICHMGFAGRDCEIDIDECLSNPCQNGATCQDQVNSYRCICQPGYWGPNCELSTNNSIPTAIESHSDLRIGDFLLGSGNPWAKCSNPLPCWTAFKNGKCDQECNTPECLYDGNDCYQPTDKHSSHSSTNTRICDEKTDSFCLKNYANGICNQECNSPECGWDGADCEAPAKGDFPINTEAQGLLIMRVEPAINIGTTPNDSHWNIEMARLLRKVSVITNTILKIESLHQVEEGRGTEIVLIADNRKCQSSCYNNTELMAKFLSAVKTRTRDFDRSVTSGALKMTDIRSQVQADIFDPNQRNQTTFYIVGCAMIVTVCALMVISIGNKKKVKEKAIVWFPEGFKPVPSLGKRDPTRKHTTNGRGVSTLQALGGNFLRGIKRNERTVSSNPSGLHSTDVDRCATATPNGGGIYHEPYDQYDQYGTYNGTESSSMVNNVDEPMTPTPLPIDPIDMQGPHGYTPLMVASMSAPFSKEPLGLVAYGTTGEMDSSACNNVTDLLNRGAQLSQRSQDRGETPLHLAARYGRVENARDLLERCDSQDVNAQDLEGRTPLHAAIAADSLGVFELLIRCRGTDLNAQTHDGTTPLILAAKVSSYSMLEELIQNECEVTKSDSSGRTALHWAAATNNVDAIRRLLAVRETNKDAQDHQGVTPLFLAAREGAKGAVELLLNHNANKDISDLEDQSPIEIARSRKHFEIVRLLEEHEPTTPRSLTSMHQSSRQLSPFSPLADSNSNGSTALQANYHTHSHSGTARNGGRLAQKAVALARSNSTKQLPVETTIIRNNMQRLNGVSGEGVIVMTPLPDSPFSLESLSSPPGTYSYQQYQPNHPSVTSQRQTAGVYI